MKTLFRIGLPALVLFLAGCSGSASTANQASDDGPIVAMIGGQPVTLREFEQQYLRTSADSIAAAHDSLSAYEDFLDRYVDFRLKVLEAERAGYGNRPDLDAELQQYKAQLARPYLLEREVMEPLVRELYERRQEMVDASHILIRILEDAVPGDTLRAWQRLSAIADSIRDGADFADMAIRHSEDPSAKYPPGQAGSGGRLGYFAGGRMVKPFEDAMFTTPVGQLSPIIRTQFGYHLLKVNGRRNTVPDLRVSHILIQPRGMSPEDTLATWNRMQAAMNRLADGTPFADVARDLSDDGQSAGRGGDLDFISYDGWLPFEMRDPLFAADSLGAVLGPIRTRFGWHFMKITDRRPLPSFDEMYDSLQDEVTRLPRAQSAEREYAKRLRRMRGSTIDSTVAGMLLGTRGADSLLTEFAQSKLAADLRSRRFLTLGDSTYTLGQFADFMANSQVQGSTGQERFWTGIDTFLEEKAIAYEIEALEGRDAGFARTMREFREGLMLFRLMEDSVWTAATEDSVGLRAWFDAHNGKYAYGDRTRIVAFYSPADSVLRTVAARLSDGSALADVVEWASADTTGSLRVDTTLVEGVTDSVFDRALEIAPGQNTGVVSFGGGRVVLVNDGSVPARPKTFEEARAEVANEWQDQLEARLVARLRASHGVRTHPEVLGRAFAKFRTTQSGR